MATAENHPSLMLCTDLPTLPPSLSLSLSLFTLFAFHFPHKFFTIQLLERDRTEIMILVVFTVTLLLEEEKNTILSKSKVNSYFYLS